MDTDPKYSSEELIEKIESTWGDYDDFEKGGFEYVAFVISQDLQDMEDDDWDEDESIEELADICINAMRMIHEQGHDPTEEIYERLENHEEKNPPELVEKYQRLFKEHKSEE